MEIRANYFLVGLFSIALLLGGVAFVMWMGSNQKNVPMAAFDIAFDESVKGLSVGNDVLFTGIRVGQVSQITISREVPGQVTVRINVDANTPVRQDSVAQLETRGITGQSIISISGGTVGSPLVQIVKGSVGTIRYEPSTLSTMVAQMPDILNSANQLLKRMERVFSEENAQKIDNIISSLDETTSIIAKRSKTIDSLLAETERTVKHAGNVMESADKLMATDVKSAARALRGAANRMDSTLKDIGPNLKQFAVNGLSEMTDALAELKNIINVFTNIGNELESSPRRFLFGKQLKEHQN